MTAPRHRSAEDLPVFADIFQMIPLFDAPGPFRLDWLLDRLEEDTARWD